MFLNSPFPCCLFYTEMRFHKRGVRWGPHVDPHFKEKGEKGINPRELVCTFFIFSHDPLNGQTKPAEIQIKY